MNERVKVTVYSGLLIAKDNQSGEIIEHKTVEKLTKASAAKLAETLGATFIAHSNERRDYMVKYSDLELIEE